MSDATARLRMFAGPNGSGKSTLKNVLPAALLGFYLNPDEIEKKIASDGVLDFADYGLVVYEEDVRLWFAGSVLLRDSNLHREMRNLRFDSNCLDFSRVTVNSYVASVLVGFLRHRFVQAGISFTFETVMSHVSKVEFLATARQTGFRTYLYYVATDDPEINVSRVRNRVAMGGHDVPEDKIISRYYRSLDLLIDAIRNTDRAFIFDNSGSSRAKESTWLAEVTDGKTLELKTDRVPAWFKKYVLDKTVG